MKVVVTGAAGQLGAAIVQEFAADYDVAALTRAHLDVTDRRRVLDQMRTLQPDVLVNCAAYNDVDAAERDPAPALEVNALAVLPLAQAAAERGATFIHFSTDFVFDGESNRPYVEDDEPRPRSMYGLTKLLGERLAEEETRYFVLRVESLFGGPTAGVGAREGSLGTIVRRLRAGEEVPVFTDRTVSPAYAPDVAGAVRRLIEGDAPGGLYHCVNQGHATWEAVAREAAMILGVQPRLKPVRLADVRLAASRPAFCALDTAKLRAAGVVMRTWQDALRVWLSRTAKAD